ncbi:uncharacterized protein LOC110724192 isoform X2 [Chenopodium quinoa]|uniref:uncharacterized protein LOC110724192 isoform X2 n=1 Tax=Chenopodium quinoa TaxID=63459 RepID=UPI000B78E1B5|nr:uncharacterized protein LOC110724192 isoform X2 [Chenopodium quinoa]
MIGASSQLTGCMTVMIAFRIRKMVFVVVVVGVLCFCWWGIYLRLMVWDSEHVRGVVDEDRKSDEEFGYLPVLDIAYGEDHPLVPRNDGDLELVRTKAVDNSLNNSVSSMADQVFALLTPRLISLVEGIVGSALGSGGSKAGTKINQDMHTFSSGKGSQPHLSGSSNKGAKVLKAPKEKVPAVKEKESCNSSNGEVGMMTRDTSYDKRLETFVKGWKDLKDEKH